MDGALIFCKDSILRFRSDYDELTAVPMLSLQACMQGDNSLFILQYFRHLALIEEGTTLADIFLAIKPWAKLLGIYLDIDVMAYIDEIRRPSDSEPLFDWIGIQKVTSVHRAYLHQEMKPGEDISSYFNRDRIPTKRFDIESACTANGYKKEDREHYSISGNIHTIKNIPVVLSDRQVLVSYGHEESCLINPNHSGVSITNKLSYIQGTVTFSFIEILEAIFNDGLFYYSPEAASDNMEAIKEMAEQLEKNEQSSRHPMDNDPRDTRKDKEKREVINIAEGAFDPMIEHMEAEQEYWQYLKSLCDSKGELPIRIGHIAEALPPEYRFSNFILDEQS